MRILSSFALSCGLVAAALALALLLPVPAQAGPASQPPPAAPSGTH